MTSCPLLLMYPHLPDTFTGNKMGVESSEGFPVVAPVDGALVDDEFCEHPMSARERTNSRNTTSERVFNPYPLEPLVESDPHNHTVRAAFKVLIFSNYPVACTAAFSEPLVDANLSTRASVHDTRIRHEFDSCRQSR